MSMLAPAFVPFLGSSHGVSRVSYRQLSPSPRKSLFTCLNRRAASIQVRTTPVRILTSAQLTLPETPNEEADWVVVDITTQYLSEDNIANNDSSITDTFTAAIADDAKTLVRVLLRDAAVELSIVLCTDAFIQTLNVQWRQKDAPTDVLSFPQDDPDGVVLGDVVISMDTAQVQAAERSYELRDEIRVLLVHGVLHLLGYDHEGKKEGDWLVMAQMENRLMSTLGWNGEGLVSITQPDYLRDITKS